MRTIGAIILSLSVLLASGVAFAGGDVKKGKRVFNKCKACHTLAEGKNRIGPSLHGIIGRKSGTAPKFHYSSAMKKADVVWDEKTLDEFLSKPRTFIHGTKMSFPGLNKKADREDVIAYLKEASK